jgi:hypothetical protein
VTKGLKMKLIFTGILTAALVLSGCAPSTSTAQPAGLNEYSPLDTRTGIREVDNVLAAVASGNPRELYALVNYTVAPCTTAEGLGGPPKCTEGEAEGTLLEVLPLIGSEGGFIRKNEIGRWQGIDVVALYSVYRVSETALNEEYYPPGEYLIIFVPRENEPAVDLRVANGGIVRVNYHFDVFPESLQTIIVRDSSEVILVPKSR